MQGTTNKFFVINSTNTCHCSDIWCATQLELILHPSTVHLHTKTHTARMQSSNIHSLLTLSISLHLCFKPVIRNEKYRITLNLRCTFLTFSQTENQGAYQTQGIIFHYLGSLKNNFSWSASDRAKRDTDFWTVKCIRLQKL